MNFPDSPVLNQIFVYGGRTFRWTGVAWKQDLSSTLVPGKYVLVDSDNNPTLTVTDQLLADRWSILAS